MTCFDRVANFLALINAANRAARGHRHRREVASFLADLEPSLLQLERELRSETYAPQPYRTFEIVDPKPRTISAAAFRDRVVHHALCAELVPVLEHGAVPWSFACRPGHGVLAALRHVRAMTRRHRYVLKLDVRHYFETLSHAVLKRLLWRRVADTPLRRLLDVFIDAGAPGSSPGRGLPIGNLTSQHFANFMLGSLDRLVTRGLRAPGYRRYMDDVLVFGADKASLWHVFGQVDRFLRTRLGLKLKPEVTRVLPVTEGVPYLGFVVFPTVTRLDPSRLRRFRRRLLSLDRGLWSGSLAESEAAQRASSLIGWARHADTVMLRRSWLERRASALIR